MMTLLPPEVLFSDEYNRPVFQMGPCDAAALARNSSIAAASGVTEVDWREWFSGSGPLTLTLNGREAIDLALGELGLARSDEILIVTTSGSPYVSNCVTSAIEKRCAWSREAGPLTRAIFLIHEFGFPARLSLELTALGLPIIEDCAYAYGTRPSDGSTGSYGDFVIWSFSKAVPLPFGGLLKSREPISGQSRLSVQGQRYAPPVAASYLREAEAAFEQRRRVFEAYRKRFATQGFRPLFEPEAGVVPHAFVVAMDDEKLAAAIKPRMQAMGVISSVFYGGGGYFLPNHQGLSDAGVEYIVANFMAAFKEASER